MTLYFLLGPVAIRTRDEPLNPWCILQARARPRLDGVAYMYVYIYIMEAPAPRPTRSPHPTRPFTRRASKSLRSRSLTLLLSVFVHASNGAAGNDRLACFMMHSAGTEIVDQISQGR